MKRLFVLALWVLFLFFSWQVGFCVESDIPQDKIIAVATAAVKAEGIKLDEVNIIYDEGGKLWQEKLGKISVEDTSPNYGILKQGFLKNYRVVFFDFKEPVPDAWVFIDKDTGEVLTVYREPQNK